MEQNRKIIGVQVTARATDVLRALKVQPGGPSLMLEFERAWGQCKPHFTVVAAEEAPSSVEAFYDLRSTRSHPVRQPRTNPNQRGTSNQCQQASAGKLSS